MHERPQHPPEAVVNARALLEECDEWALAALQSVTMECKSLVIALALAFRKTTVEKVRAYEESRNTTPDFTISRLSVFSCCIRSMEYLSYVCHGVYHPAIPEDLAANELGRSVSTNLSWDTPPKFVGSFLWAPRV